MEDEKGQFGHLYVQRLWFFSFKNRKHLDGFFGGSFSLGFPNRLRPTPCPRRLFLLLAEGITATTRGWARRRYNDPLLTRTKESWRRQKRKKFAAMAGIFLRPHAGPARGWPGTAWRTWQLTCCLTAAWGACACSRRSTKEQLLFFGKASWRSWVNFINVLWTTFAPVDIRRSYWCPRRRLYGVKLGVTSSWVYW